MKWTASTVFATVASVYCSNDYLRLILLIVAFVAFFKMLSALPSIRALIIASALTLACCCIMAPRGSGDVYMYSMFGSVAVNHHANPYKHAPQ